MKKSDLKQLIKPLVKECIHEVLIEEGMLSNVVSEVAKGMQGAVLTESVAPSAYERTPDPPPPRQNNAQRKQLMDAIGAEAYNGVNLFEGTEAMSSYEAAEPRGGSVDLGNPGDSGVDISSLMGPASRMWNAMK